MPRLLFIAGWDSGDPQVLLIPAREPFGIAGAKEQTTYAVHFFH